MRGALVEKRTCSLDGCERPARKRGMCNTDYVRLMRQGVIQVLPKLGVRERFLLNVTVAENGCHPWTGQIAESGHGRFEVGDRPQLAHRVAYELFVGPIPEGLQLDHVCHTRDLECPGGPSCLHRRCVNADHLEPVTGLENTLRGRGPTAANAIKTRCPAGHSYDDQNTYTHPRNGQRTCRACRAKRMREANAAKRAERNGGDIL